MRRLIEFATEGEETILVEVEDIAAPDELVRAARAEVTPGKAAKKFEDALVTVKSVAERIIQQLDSLRRAPDQAEVEFGLNLKADVGAFVAKAGTEAHFKVKLTWTTAKK